MAKHSDTESDSGPSAVDLSKIDKVRLLCAEERRKRAGDEEGNIEDYLSSSSSSEANDSENDSGGSSSESEVEDDNGELISPELDAQIMKTLTALRSKDKSVYDSEINFFSAEAIKAAEDAWKQKHKAKPSEPQLSLTEYQHRVNVEHGGVVDEANELRKAVKGMTHVEEQQALKNAFKAAVESEDEGEDGDAGLLVKKLKTQEDV
ncbi:Ribosome biogenesis protein Kri1, partial [Coemansia erecta]